MKWTWQQIMEHLLSAGAVTALITLIAKKMDWIRFKPKDQAAIDKVRAETASDLADVSNKKIDDEVKISKAALEWAVQLAGQLEKANILNEKRQHEIERLQEVKVKMREDFERRLDEMEAMLDASKKECDDEREKNKELIEQLNIYINGRNK